MTLPSNFIKAIASFASPIATNMMERQEVIIKLRKKFKLEHESLPDNFPMVYKYTLVEYGVGKEEPLLNLFEQSEIQEAFRDEFRKNNPVRLEEAIEKEVKWEYEDWNTLGPEVKKLADEAKLDIQEYLRQEIEAFRKVFYQEVLPLTLKPSQRHQDKKIEEILKNLKRLETLDEIRTAVQEVIQLIKDNSTFSQDDTATETVSLNPKLQETLNFYLRQCYRNEQVAKLDQAGERDSEKDTYLKNIFVDLDVSLRGENKREKLRSRKFRQRINTIRQTNGENTELIREEDLFIDEEKPLSLMQCLLKELDSRVVIIGGPGQGKSTSGQQLAQIHRAKLLNENYDDQYQPDTVRIPFQVILKDFAQWLADKPEIDALESYLAERIAKLAKRPGDVHPQDIQEIFTKRNCLLLLDGLDEVVEPKLQKQMLNKIEDFLHDRQSSTENNILVVATSRPNSYDNQFDPEQFIYLELDLLNEEKVTEYAQKWVTAKKLTEDDSSTTLNILKNCQKDTHIKGLLTTPLQVTIILIIIKNSKRQPPSQREELFNEYWLTIFRREASKDGAKEIVKSNEKLLLSLHSFLGYSLHRRAIKKNVQSLLSKSEFEELVTKFLKEKKGDCTSDDEIRKEMNRLVRELGERLVLIVQKEAGSYGFDLRSFQEFFAAIYLVQQAKNTKQRFQRLTAIAPYKHWRNVALFAAGRIARNFSGEVSQLREVWCFIDRKDVNRYLKPGAWLALQIAADGSLTDETNLQYSALDDGLTVLETGLTNQQNAELKSLLRRLTKEEKNKILRPILEKRLSLLPESCLMTGLSIYGEFFGGNKFFQEKLDTILQGENETLINEALNLSINYQLSPSWIAEKFSKHWSYLEENFEKIFFRKFEYTKKILEALEKLPENRLLDLLDNIGQKRRHFVMRTRKPESIIRKLLTLNMDSQTSYSISDQLIIFVLLQSLISELSNIKNTYTVEININNEEYGKIEIYQHKSIFTHSLLNIKDELKSSLKEILQFSNLFPVSKLFSWYLLIYFDSKNRNYISSFLKALASLKMNEIFGWKILIDSLKFSYPLLLLAGEFLIEAKKDTVKDLVSFVDSNKQEEVSLYIQKTTQKYMKLSTDENKREFVISILYRINPHRFFTELSSMINTTKISEKQIIEAHFSRLIFRDKKISHNIMIIRDLLSTVMIDDKNKIYNFEILTKLLRILASPIIHWSLNKDEIEQTIQFFELIIKNVDVICEQNSEYYADIFQLTFALFFKLVDYGYSSKNLFTLVSNFPLYSIKISPFLFRFNIVLSKAKIDVLDSLLKNNDREIFLKGAIIWKPILDEVDRHPYERENSSKFLANISFTPDIGKRLLQEEDSQFHAIGITFLTYSEYPQ